MLDRTLRVAQLGGDAHEVGIPVREGAVEAAAARGLSLVRINSQSARRAERQSATAGPPSAPERGALPISVARARYDGGARPHCAVATLDCGADVAAAAARFRAGYDAERLPVVVRGLDIGACARVWTAHYLSEAVDPARVMGAGVHRCESACIDLAGHRPPNTPKNFAFVQMGWREFVARASAVVEPATDGVDEHYYLRTVAEGAAAKREASHLSTLFPELAADVRLPAGVLYPPSAYHSSVLRIASAGTQLWTHFDTMDNALMQTTGRKRVVLWPPAEADNLYTDASSSRVDDIDAPDLAAFPRFALAERARLECILEPGDVLFIPALWFHNVTSLDFSIAINVFWRGLDDAAEYNPKDLYGNKDLRAAERAVAAAEKAARLLAHLPEPYRSFYAHRAALALERAACAAAPDTSTPVSEKE